MDSDSGIGAAITALAKIGFDRGARDDDTVDRLNHLVMYGILIVFAVGAAAKQYVGEPIFCWVPVEYKKVQFKNYVNNYCWVHSMYHVPFEDAVPVVEEQRYHNDISYYRWASVMFLVLAVLFRLPQMFWKLWKSMSGSSLERITKMTMETYMMDDDARFVQLGHVAEFIHRWIVTRAKIESNSRYSRFWQVVSKCTICVGTRSGHNLVLSYLLVKLLYLANVIAQFFIISRFLKLNFWTFGTDALQTFVQEGAWQDHHNFPRIALCDFKIRQLNNVLTYTVQCVLSINLFLEKMFLFVWFCLIFMVIANALSLFKWVYQLMGDSKTTQFLMKYSGIIIPAGTSATRDQKEFRDMAKRYLKQDGVFLVRMIAINTSELLAVDLLKQIVKRYRKHRVRNENTTIPNEESRINGGLRNRSDG